MEEGRETDSAGTAIILDVGVRYGLQGLLLPSRSSLLDLKLIKKNKHKSYHGAIAAHNR